MYHLTPGFINEMFNVKGMEHVPNMFMSFDKYKQEMKPYYNIVHKDFQAAILRKLRQFF